MPRLVCAVCRVQSRQPSVLVTFPGSAAVDLPVCSRCLSTSTNAWAAIGLQMTTRAAPAGGTASEARSAPDGGAGGPLSVEDAPCIVCGGYPEDHRLTNHAYQR